MAGVAWTVDEDRLLRELVVAGFSNDEIGPRLSRTGGAVANRVADRRLGGPARAERSGLKRAVRAALADGRWHGIHELTARAGETIAPERALRAFHATGAIGADLDSRVYSGRRTKVASVLSRIPGVERRGPSRDREYRLAAPGSP